MIGAPGPGKASDGKDPPVLRIHAALHGETQVVVEVGGTMLCAYKGKAMLAVSLALSLSLFLAAGTQMCWQRLDDDDEGEVKVR